VQQNHSVPRQPFDGGTSNVVHAIRTLPGNGHLRLPSPAPVRTRLVPWLTGTQSVIARAATSLWRVPRSRRQVGHKITGAG